MADAQITANKRTVSVRFFRVGVEEPDLASIIQALGRRK